ncbi:major histocompatibility complex class I-related gene protein-like isoform X1 [Ictalurus furcatus]|uniref:major histocompatibility complex class I-related gene protein-like isoform X1 n=1 Tax=Ictalurus furcatus TaxID=66913 RepID=UPI0023502B8A|nr:major histocompatibility complex class I-related gene protein-like isoform X1 [Ictalurus furcatus]
MGWTSLIFSASVLLCAAVPVLSDRHQLYYTYTALSKPIKLPGIYEFTALGMLDDRELDYYTSETQAKIPKQDWMREKMPQDYWEKGTQSRKSKEQWFKVNVDILMERMGHNKTDLHVLQWRHGCEIDEDTDGNIKFVSGVDEYSYDGTEFLSFDEVNSRWIAPVPAAQPTKRKWDEVPILNQYTKGYLEKECVDWLKKFMEYGKEELKKYSPPKAYISAKPSVTDPSKYTLSCLATGFLPPDAKMCLRKSRTSLPEHLVKSSGIVPNGDGTYQLRSHTDIVMDTTVVYDCYITQSALDKPIIIEWVFKEESSVNIGIIIGAVVCVLLLVIVVIVILALKMKGKVCLSTGGSENKSFGGSSSGSSTESIKLDGNSGKDNTDPSRLSSKEEVNENTQSLLPATEGHSDTGSDSKDAKDSDSTRDSGKGSASGSSASSQESIDETSKMLQTSELV